MYYFNLKSMLLSFVLDGKEKIVCNTTCHSKLAAVLIFSILTCLSFYINFNTTMITIYIKFSVLFFP